MRAKLCTLRGACGGTLVTEVPDMHHMTARGDVRRPHDRSLSSPRLEGAFCLCVSFVMMMFCTPSDGTMQAMCRHRISHYGQRWANHSNTMQAIRDTITAVTGQQLPAAIPEPELVAHGNVLLQATALLLDNLDQLHIDGAPIDSDQPLTMEGYGLAYGMLSYTCASTLCTESSSLCTMHSCIPRASQSNTASVCKLHEFVGYNTTLCSTCYC